MVRMENLLMCVDFLLRHFDTNITVLEASGYENKIVRKLLDKKVKYLFMEDYDTVFYRTRYLNKMIQDADTPYIGIWDADVIVPESQIMDSVEKLRKGCDMAYPYDGRFYDTTEIIREIFLKTGKIQTLIKNTGKMYLIYGDKLKGGAVLANRNAYMEAGMENEKFYGWGPEDGERYERCNILNYRIHLSKGCLYHLTHQRGSNSSFRSMEQEKNTNKEYILTALSSKDEIIKNNPVTLNHPGQAVLFLSNKSSDFVLENYHHVKKAESEHTDVCYLYHSQEEILPEVIQKEKHFIFTDRILQDMGYKPLGDKLLPGNNHFPLLKFYLENPQYDYYWNIEDDVFFTGDWNCLFDTFKQDKSDFIAAYMETYEEDPGWYWWFSLKTPEPETTAKVCSFNPVYRLSNRALKCLDEALKNGWSGHHEVSIPTILYNKGYKLKDMGGTGSFVPFFLKNRFYTRETHHFLPVKMGEQPNKIYHPIKEKYMEKQEMQDGYENNRRNFKYVKRIIALLIKFAGDKCESIMDVGSGGVDVISGLPLKSKVSIDLTKPIVAVGVESITGDFFDYRSKKLFDIVCCFQTLEHIVEVEKFTEKLFDLAKKYVFISVPYKWSKGIWKGHIHDPVDEEKMVVWTKRTPIVREVVIDRDDPRLICVYEK